MPRVGCLLEEDMEIVIERWIELGNYLGARWMVILCATTEDLESGGGESRMSEGAKWVISS